MAKQNENTEMTDEQIAAQELSQQTVETPTVENKMKTFNLEQCAYLRDFGDARPYQNTKPGSRYDGKFYKTYQIEGITFTIISTDKFCKDQAEENVDTLNLMKTDTGYDYVSHKTITATDRIHNSRTRRAALTIEFVQQSMNFSKEDWG